jgi:hypothetical protein
MKSFEETEIVIEKGELLEITERIVDMKEEEREREKDTVNATGSVYYLLSQCISIMRENSKEKESLVKESVLERMKKLTSDSFPFDARKNTFGFIQHYLEVFNCFNSREKQKIGVMLDCAVERMGVKEERSCVVV